MFRNIFTKTLYEKRWMVLGWSIGLVAMTLLTMAFFPYFKESGFDEVFKNAPETIKGLIGDAAAYKTVTGYVGQQVFAFRLPMLTIILSVMLFSSLSVGDENKGTLETLLAEPVTRAQVYFHKYAAGVVALGITCSTIIIGVLLSYPIIDGTMDFSRLVLATIGCWVISLVFGTLTYALGMITGCKGITIAVSSAVAFLSYLISSMAPAVEKLHGIQKAMPFYYYTNPSIAEKGINSSHMLVLAGIILVLLVAGISVFRRRDLVRGD